MPKLNLLQVTEKKKEPPQLTGRDEMNLAEFALGLASDRNLKNVKTIERKQSIINPDGKRLDQTWTITGSDQHGLPRAGDDDVLLALLKLASDQGLQERVVHFTRYELMQILDWPTNGRTYKRIESSLDRLAGVRILAKNSFWDNARKSYTSLNFGLIDDYLIADQPCRVRVDGQMQMPFTHVSFNEKFFQSMQVGNMKRLDMKLYNSLKSAVSKRMYRYLDKRRYRSNVFDVELNNLATVNLGLDLGVRRYASQIKQLLDPAHLELQARGFLSDWSYRWSPDRETWFVQYRFAAIKAVASANDGEKEETTANQLALMACGLSLRLAAKLDRLYPERIQSKIDIFEQLKKTNSQLIARNPAGWLRKAIEDDYQAVPGYQTPEQRHEKAQRKQELLEAQERIEQQEKDAKDALWALYTALPLLQKQELQEQALKQLSFLPSAKRKQLGDNDPLLRGVLLSLLEESATCQL
jgi:plasmid replication initiation protein